MYLKLKSCKIENPIISQFASEIHTLVSPYNNIEVMYFFFKMHGI